MAISIRLVELATQIGARLDNGQVADQLVQGIASLRKADQRHISFFSNPSYRHDLQNTRAAAVILSADDSVECRVPTLIMGNPYLGYAQVIDNLNFNS